MKKIATLIVTTCAALLLLTACVNPLQKQACNNEDTRRISYAGTVDLTITECWTSSLSQDVLTLKKEDQSAQVLLQKMAPSDSSLTVQESFLLSTGETLYALVSNPLDEESLKLVDSIQIKSWSIGASSCVPPDQYYAEAQYYTWQKITFALPYCWGAEESHTLRDEPALLLYRNETDNLYTRVNFWFNHELQDSYTFVKDLTLSDLPVHQYEHQEDEGTTSTLFVFEGTAWTLETNTPDDSNVQLILNSLSFQ